MTDELKTLLTTLGIGASVGLVIGILLRKFTPGFCKRYAKFCSNRKWPIFSFGAVLFAVLSIDSFLNNRNYFGLFYTVFCLFELYCLFVYGFKRLTPEQERRIDESDPSKLSSLRFWKK